MGQNNSPWCLNDGSADTMPTAPVHRITCLLAYMDSSIEWQLKYGSKSTA